MERTDLHPVSNSCPVGWIGGWSVGNAEVLRHFASPELRSQVKAHILSTPNLRPPDDIKQELLGGRDLGEYATQAIAVRALQFASMPEGAGLEQAQGLLGLLTSKEKYEGTEDDIWIDVSGWRYQHDLYIGIDAGPIPFTISIPTNMVGRVHDLLADAEMIDMDGTTVVKIFANSYIVILRPEERDQAVQILNQLCTIMYPEGGEDVAFEVAISMLVQ